MEGDTASGNPSPAMPEAAYAQTEEPDSLVAAEELVDTDRGVAVKQGVKCQPMSASYGEEETEMEVEGGCNGIEGTCTVADNEDSLAGQQDTGDSIKAMQVSATSSEVGGVCMEGDVSRESTPLVVGGVVTEEMVMEERRMMERASRENSNEGEEVRELGKMLEQQRFTRLQHLLQKSSIYSKFLLQRMENQVKEKKEVEEKQGRRKKVIQGADSSREGERASKGKEAATGDSSQEEAGSQEDTGGGASGRVTRSRTRPGGKTDKSQDAKVAGGQKGRGRKRKADTEGYKLSDYMDNQGHLKKRKLESGKSQPTKPKKDEMTGEGRGNGSKSVEDEVEEERYYNGKLIPANQPKLLTGGIMRSYQLDGMEWIKVLYENGVNGILADEMGLGKTIQCISVIAHMIEMGVKGPFLVAAPLSTVANWVGEFKQFTPTIPVVLYHGTIPEREKLRRKMFGSAHRRKGKVEELQPVVVTSYEICMRDQRFLCDRSWKFLVVDEGHRIKNLNCKLIKALKSYDAANRLLLTGTPLQNNLAELWSLLNFLLPDIFDDLNSFQSWFDFDSSGVDEAREKIIAQEREQQVLSTLHQILTPFLLRRLKTDVEFCIPPKKEVLVYAPLTASQERYYKSLLDNTIVEMVEAGRVKQLAELAKRGKEMENGSGEGCGLEGDGESGTLKRTVRRRKSRNGYAQLSDNDFESIMKGEAEIKDFVTEEEKEDKKKAVAVVSMTNIKMTNVWMMLRKCCNHPYLLEFPMTPDGQFRVDEEIVNSCGKVMLLDRMLSALIKGGHKTLVFSQFTMMLDILEDYMDLRGLTYSRLDGSMGFAERERQMIMFRKSPDCHVFLLSTRAGGLGINLTAADTVIIYDSDWNPQCDLQAMDRCHRIGQTKPVMVYRLVTGNTIDQRIVERAAGKRKLEKMVIHKGKFKGYGAENQQLSLDALVDLLNSVDHDKVVTSKDAVISDEALLALLDRSFSGEQNRKIGGQKAKHTEVFKVLEERDEQGNILHTLEAKSESSNNSSNSEYPSANNVMYPTAEPTNNTLSDAVSTSSSNVESPAMIVESTCQTSSKSVNITSSECQSASRDSLGNTIPEIYARESVISAECTNSTMSSTGAQPTNSIPEKYTDVAIAFPLNVIPISAPQRVTVECTGNASTESKSNGNTDTSAECHRSVNTNCVSAESAADIL